MEFLLNSKQPVAFWDASAGQPSSEYSRLAPQLFFILYPLALRAEGGACQSQEAKKKRSGGTRRRFAGSAGAG